MCIDSQIRYSCNHNGRILAERRQKCKHILRNDFLFNLSLTTELTCSPDGEMVSNRIKCERERRQRDGENKEKTVIWVRFEEKCKPCRVLGISNIGIDDVERWDLEDGGEVGTMVEDGGGETWYEAEEGAVENGNETAGNDRKGKGKAQERIDRREERKDESVRTAEAR